jgi:hypothetical protein
MLRELCLAEKGTSSNIFSMRRQISNVALHHKKKLMAYEQPSTLPFKAEQQTS